MSKSSEMSGSNVDNLLPPSQKRPPKKIIIEEEESPDLESSGMQSSVSSADNPAKYPTPNPADQTQKKKLLSNQFNETQPQLL